MNFESFLTYPRWEILQILSEKPSSPSELASELNTTPAYVSQQLKVLDAAQLVTKIKTGASEKGKPRSLFQLSGDFIFLASLIKGASEKKLIDPTDYHLAILKIWTIEDKSLHYFFEKLYWKLDENLDKIDAIFLDTLNHPKLLVVSESKSVREAVHNYLSKFSKKISCVFLSKQDLVRHGENLISLHDPLLLSQSLIKKRSEDANEY